MTVQLQFGVLRSGEKIVITDVGPGLFTPADAADLSNCRLVSPQMGASLTSCVLLNRRATLGFEVTFASPTFIQVQIDHFQNPSSVNEYIFEIERLNTEGIVLEAQFASLNNLQPLMISDAQMQPLVDEIGSRNGILEFQFVTNGSTPVDGTLDLQVPLWNPYAPESQQQEIFTSLTPTCTGIEGFDDQTLLCIYDSSRKSLSIQKLSQRPSGTRFTVQIHQVKNPYDARPRAGFQLRVLDKDGHRMQESQELSFEVSGTTSFKALSITPIDAKVSGSSTYRLSYNLDLPSEASCKLRITAPVDFKISETVSQVKAFKAFKDTKLDVEGQTITLYGCPGYTTPQNNFDSINLLFLQNPKTVRDSAPFQVSFYLFDGLNEYLTAWDNKTAFVHADQLKPGTVSDVQLVASNPIVQEETTFSIRFRTDMDIPLASRLEIHFAKSLAIADNRACTLEEPLVNALAVPWACVIYQNVLRIDKIYSDVIPAGELVELGVKAELRNPIASGDSGKFTIRIFEAEADQSFLLSEGNNDGVYQVFPGELQFISPLKVSSVVAYSPESAYTLKGMPSHTIPKNGAVRVIMPPEVTIHSELAVQTQARLSIAVLPNSYQYMRVISVDKGAGVVILGGIFQEDFSPTAAPTSAIEVVIPGLLNPRSMAQTSSFIMETLSADGSVIDRLESGLDVAMMKPGELTDFSVQPMSFLNGEQTTYVFKVVTNAPMVDRDRLTFTFPKEISFGSTQKCEVSSDNLRQITCLKLHQTFTFVMLFKRTHDQLEGKISAGDTLEFSVTEVVNPSSLQPTSPFTNIQTTDLSGNSISDFLMTQRKITMQQPGKITHANLTSSNDQPWSMVTLKFDLVTVNDMPIDCSFVISFPREVNVENDLKLCSVSILSNTYRRSCVLNKETRTVIMRGGLPSMIAAGTKLTIVLGDFQNPPRVLNESFVVQTYVDGEATYLVDQVTQGLFLDVRCNFPCKNCISRDQPDQCTECYLDGTTEFKFLRPQPHYQCVDQCYAGTYASPDGSCMNCFETCQTCSQEGRCLTCDKSGPYPFMYQSMCRSECPKGTYSDDTGGECLVCQEPCLECTGPRNGQCLSCAQSLQNKEIFLQKQFCQTSCSDGYTHDASFTCVACRGCLTCETTPTRCTSCPPNYFKLGSTCASICPDGFFSHIESAQCLGCDPKCRRCSGADPATQICEACSVGYYVFDGICHSECPEGYRPDVLTNQYCQLDTGGPLTLQERLASFPPCFGTGPVSVDNFLVYFPFTFALVLAIGLSLVSFYYHKPDTNLLALLSAAIAPIETVALFVLMAQAFEVEKGIKFQCVEDAERGILRSNYPIVCYVSLACILIMYGLNAYNLHTILTSRKLRDDPQFGIWRRKFYKSSYPMVLVIQTATSFRFTTLWVSGWLGRRRYKAKFSKNSGQKVWNRMIAHLGISSLLIYSMPVLVAVVSGLYFHKWGTQLYIALLDMFILSITSMSIQLCWLRKEQRANQSMIQPQIKLRSGFEDSASCDGTERSDINENDCVLKEQLPAHTHSLAYKKAIRKSLMGKNQFNVNDVMGDLERQADLNLKFVEHDGFKYDRQGRRVNERGYLVSEKGDIVNQLGEIVFALHDLNPGGELPASQLFHSHNFNGHEIVGNYESVQPQVGGNKFENTLPKDQNGLKLNKFGYIVDQAGNIQTRSSRRILEKNYFAANGDMPPLLNYRGLMFNIRDIMGRLIRDDVQGEAVLKLHASTCVFWDKDARQVNRRGYLVDNNGNVIDKKNRVVFRSHELQSDGEVPKIFKFTKFDPRDVMGRFTVNKKGRPQLRRASLEADLQPETKVLSSYLRLDDDNHLVNRLGFLCDSQGNIVDKNNNLVFSKAVLTNSVGLPPVVMQGLKENQSPQGQIKGRAQFHAHLESLTDLMKDVLVADNDLAEKVNILASPHLRLSSYENLALGTGGDQGKNIQGQYEPRPTTLGSRKDAEPNDFDTQNMCNQSSAQAFSDKKQLKHDEDLNEPEEVSEQDEADRLKRKFLRKLTELHHGHIFGYIGGREFSNASMQLIQELELSSIKLLSKLKAVNLKSRETSATRSPLRASETSPHSRSSPPQTSPRLNAAGSSAAQMAAESSPFKRNQRRGRQNLPLTYSSPYQKSSPRGAAHKNESPSNLTRNIGQLTYPTAINICHSPQNSDQKLLRDKPSDQEGQWQPEIVQMNPSSKDLESIQLGSMQDQAYLNIPCIEEMPKPTREELTSSGMALARTAPEKNSRTQVGTQGDKIQPATAQFFGANLSVQQKVACLDPDVLAYLQEKILNEVASGRSPVPNTSHVKLQLSGVDQQSPRGPPFKMQTANPERRANQLLDCEREASQQRQEQSYLGNSSNLSRKNQQAKGRVNKARLRQIGDQYLAKCIPPHQQHHDERKQLEHRSGPRQKRRTYQSQTRSELTSHRSPETAGQFQLQSTETIEARAHDGGTGTEIVSRNVNNMAPGLQTVMQPELRDLSEGGGVDPQTAWGGVSLKAASENDDDSGGQHCQPFEPRAFKNIDLSAEMDQILDQQEDQDLQNTRPQQNEANDTE